MYNVGEPILSQDIVNMGKFMIGIFLIYKKEVGLE